METPVSLYEFDRQQLKYKRICANGLSNVFDHTKCGFANGSVRLADDIQYSISYRIPKTRYNMFVKSDFSDNLHFKYVETIANSARSLGNLTTVTFTGADIPASRNYEDLKRDDTSMYGYRIIGLFLTKAEQLYVIFKGGNQIKYCLVFDVSHYLYAFLLL